MNTVLQQGTMRSNIMELQSALLFTESVSMVKLPTHIIPEVEINEAGQIWFVIPRPAQHIDAFEKEIPAKMDFFKKGKDFFVKVRGTAHLITDANEVANAGLSSQLMDKLKQSQVIAVKILVQEAELVITTPKSTQNWIQNGKTQLSSWFS